MVGRLAVRGLSASITKLTIGQRERRPLRRGAKLAPFLGFAKYDPPRPKLRMRNDPQNGSKISRGCLGKQRAFLSPKRGKKRETQKLPEVDVVGDFFFGQYPYTDPV